LLDEIGRGTSTYDGISIAGVSYMSIPQLLKRCLQHYHELNEMDHYRIQNYNVAVKVKRYGSFIRKLVKGEPIVLGFMWQTGMPQIVILKAQRY
jgi:DNA mismatch repair ATPase MutS